MLFVKLKASARNSSVYPSRSVTTREAAISNCQKDGALILLRPRLPNVPGAGDANAKGLIQQFGFGLSHSEFGATWFGRCPAAAAPVNATSVLRKTVTKGADIAR